LATLAKPSILYKKALPAFFITRMGSTLPSVLLLKTNHCRVESLFAQRPSQKGIQIIETAEIIAINATKLFALYDQYSAIERLFRKIFEQGYVETVNRLESLQFYAAEERYTRLLEEMPELLQRVPLKYIASYLGITQVSLSRIRATIK